jgi:hypothetical protein
MAGVHKTILLDQVLKGNALSNVIKPVAQRLAKQKFKQSQMRALSVFEAHPVTLEIKGGGEAPNLSGTLHFPEAAKKGNLYSYIGFPEIAAANLGGLRTLIATWGKVHWRTPKKVKAGKGQIIFRFRAQVPTLAAFYQITPMPWPEGGQSWAQKVETGFSNLHFYKYKRGIPGSRSGYAIQTEKWGAYLPGSYFKPIAYLGAIVAWWHKDLMRPVNVSITAKGSGGGGMPVRPGEERWRMPVTAG